MRAPVIEHSSEHRRPRPLLRIELLGPLCIYSNGRRVPPQAWDRQKTKTLLKLLLTVPGRTFSSEEIIECLWPALEPEAAAKSLRAAMSKLRKVLEPDLRSGQESTYIRTERVGYAFQADSGCALDVHDVQAALVRGQESQRLGQWGVALQAYQAAAALYRGDFLADEPDAGWVSPHRERWRKVNQTLLFAKTECHLALGQYPTAIEVCQEIIDKDRCHEAAYRQLMLCHYLSGHLNEVVVLYRQCVETLKQDLGVEPSEETVRLHDHILRRRVPGVDKTPRSPVTVARSYRVPHSLGRLPFVGREHEMGLLVSHLDAAAGGKGGLVTITGEPGIGKTRLAEEVLVYARGRSLLTAGGRCYSPALRHPYEPFTEIFRQILKGPGREPLLALSPQWLADVAKIVPDIPIPKSAALPAESEPRRFSEALSGLLVRVSSHTPLVLLVDDLHWADAETIGVLHTVLQQIPGERLLILATHRSEERADTPALAEFLEALPRLASCTMTLPPLASRAIVELLRAAIRKGQFPAPVERLALRIFEDTQGNPLFVVEVLQTLLERGVLKVNGRGKWVLSEAVGPETNASSGLGSDGALTALKWPIPTGIRQVILSRVERLSAEARSCLGVLSTLSRWFTRDLVEAVLACEGRDVSRALDDLLRWGFLEEEPQLKGTYRFVHENTRQTVYDALPGGDKRVFHLRVAEALESRTSPGANVRELAHHYALAEQWPQAFEYTVAAADAAQWTYAFGIASSLLDQAERMLTAHASAFRPSADLTRRRLLMTKIRQRIAGEQGHAKQRERIVAEMVRLARALGDPLELADAYLALSSLHESDRDWRQAEWLAKQALTHYQRQGAQEGMAKAYRDLGYIYWRSEQVVLALEANEQALLLHRAAGNAKGEAGDLHNLAQVYTDLGQYQQGLNYYRQARLAFQRLGERREESRTLNVLSEISRATGNLAEALSNAEEALELARETGDRSGQIHSQMAIASLHHAAGRDERALAAYQAVIETARSMGGSREEGHALRGVGLLHKKRGDLDQAVGSLTRAAVLLADAGDASARAEVCERLGDLLAQSGTVERALEAYQTALSLYRSDPRPEAVRTVLSRMARIYWAEGRVNEAIALYREALRVPGARRDPKAEAGVLAALGAIYRETGALQESLKSSLRALTCARSLSSQDIERSVLSSLCDTYYALGRYSEAESSIRAALALPAATDDPRGLAWEHFRLGQVLKARGEIGAGRVSLAKAESLAHASGDHELIARVNTSASSAGVSATSGAAVARRPKLRRVV